MIRDKKPNAAYFIIVPGPPVPKARARTVTRNGKTHSYTPEATSVAQDAIGWLARDHGVPLLSGPVALTVRVYMPIPRAWSMAKKVMARARQLRPTGRPDVSNYLKLVEDALNAVAYQDDGQVVEAWVEKWYSDVPRTEIEIWILAEEHDAVG